MACLVTIAPVTATVRSMSALVSFPLSAKIYSSCNLPASKLSYFSGSELAASEAECPILKTVSSNDLCKDVFEISFFKTRATFSLHFCAGSFTSLKKRVKKNSSE